MIMKKFGVVSLLFHYFLHNFASSYRVIQIDNGHISEIMYFWPCIGEAKMCLNVLLITYILFSSCDRVDWVEERRFWTFEGLLTLLGLASGLAVFIRQKQLDHRMYQRIQRQIASA